MHVRTCNLVRHLCREIKSKIQLKHSYIYDFDPKAMLSNAGLFRNIFVIVIVCDIHCISR